MQTTTLRPGLLVSLKSSIKGNVRYFSRDIERDHVDESGQRVAKWETERTIADPAEHERAVVARSAARATISRVCSVSAFGLLCPESKVDQLEQAIKDANSIVRAFNDSATLTQIALYVLPARVAQDDVEAVRAINSEVRDLLDTMSEGIKNLDVKAVRDAANKAKGLGQMLSPDAAKRIEVAVETVREAARRIVKVGTNVAQEIDQTVLATLSEQRTAFLDLDDNESIDLPQPDGRDVDVEAVAYESPYDTNENDAPLPEATQADIEV